MLIGILIVLRCILGPNLEIFTLGGGVLWSGQAQNRVNFVLNFTLMDKVNQSPKQ